MNEDLHTIPAPFSADAGWEQMQKMPDEHLPVKRHLLQRERLIPYSVATILLMIFLFSALQLGHETTYFSVNRSSKGSKASGTFKNTSPFISQHNVYFSAPEKPARLDVGNPANTPPHQKNQLSTNTSQATYKLFKSISAGKLKNEIGDIAKVEPILPIEKSGTFLPAEMTLSKKEEMTAKKLDLSAGAGVNITLDGARQNLQPYPIFEAKYNFSRRFYVSAGLSLYTPVATVTKGINKSLYVNDTTNNIKMLNETVTFNRLHYANLPVSLGVNVTKNLSVHAGLQMSVLLNSKRKKWVEQYDFQMNNITPTTNTGLVSSNFIAAKKDNINIRNIDYSFTAGIRYTLNKVTLNLTHQRGLSPVIKGNNTDLKKNNILSFNVLYNFK